MNRRSVLAGAFGSTLALHVRAPARAAAPLRIGTMPSDFGAQVYYAKDLGLFDKADFAPQITPLASGSAIAAAVISGSLDYGYSNILSLAIAHDKGFPFVLLTAANMYRADAPTVGLIAVLRSGPLLTAKDLSGKTIATGALNNITHIGTRNWIDASGGDSSKARFVEVPISEMAAAVIAGRVDAAVMDQGVYPTLGKPSDPIRVIANAFSTIAPAFISGGWFTTADWVTKNPVAAKKIVAIMNESARWANAHHHASAVILGRYLHESPEQIDAATRVTYGTAINATLLQPPIDIAAKYAAIKAPFSARDFISTVAQ